MLFPKGDNHYFTGPIHLKSHVDLELATGAVVKFSDNFSDYLPMVKIHQSGVDMLNFSPLIYGWNVSHIAVRGNGTFDGSGKAWWDFFWTLRRVQESTGVWPTNTSWHELFFEANAELIKEHPSLKQPGFQRPSLFYPVYSQYITVEGGVTFKDSPMFVVAPYLCDNVLIDGIQVTCPSNAPNTDGIHLSSCRNATIRNSVVDTGDDGIVFTAGLGNGGEKQPTENVTIHDCTVYQAHGGIVIGSAIQGGVRNLHAHHLHFDGPLRGIRIKSIRDHGGVVEDVHFEHITMTNISHEGVTINAEYVEVPDRGFDSLTPILRNIQIHDLSGDSMDGIQLIGLPEKHFEGIELVNVNITARQEMVQRNVDHLVETNVTYLIDKHLYEGLPHN